MLTTPHRKKCACYEKFTISSGFYWYFAKRRAGNFARVADRRGVYRVLVGKPEGNRPLGKPGVDGKIILNGSSGIGRGAWTGLHWLRIGTGGGLL